MAPTSSWQPGARTEHPSRCGESSLKHWLGYFGPPEVLLSDQGSEFKGDFEAMAEKWGIAQAMCDADSPWQNGRCERHGGWPKSKIDDELKSGDGVITTLDDLDLLIRSLVSTTNRFFHRGGYTPFQIVLGINPRMPFDLFSDEHMDVVGMQDLEDDPRLLDGVSAEFAGQAEIRLRAKNEAMMADAKAKVSKAMRSRLHRGRVFALGQWVLVWRRQYQLSTQAVRVRRDRWVGPGLVVA